MCLQDKQKIAAGQAPTAVSRPKIFGEGSRVGVIHDNAVSILKRC